MLFELEDLKSTDYLLTKQLLFAISKHICQKQNFSKQEFVLTIEDKEDVSEVSINPNIEMFPDVKHKKKSDKTLLLYHVCCDHFQLEQSAQQDGHIIFMPKLVAGIYKFQFVGKKRAWVNLM